VSTQNIVYSDLDLNMIQHPINRDVSKKYNESAIARSIRNLILTNKYERAFHPELGGGLRELLFEPSTIITLDSIKSHILWLITSQEPRVKNPEVEVELSEDESTFDCTIHFTAINNRTPTTITLYLKRVK